MCGLGWLMYRLVLLSIAVLCLSSGAKASGDDHDDHDHDEEHGHHDMTAVPTPRVGKHILDMLSPQLASTMCR